MAKQVPTEVTELHDIKPLPEFHPIPWEFYLAGLLSALVLFALWQFWKKRRLPRQSTSVPQLSPEEAAMRAFIELESLRKSAQIGLRDLGTRASLTLRTFIEKTFDFAASEQTVAEFRSAFPRSLAALLPRISAEERDSLQKQAVQCLRFFERVTFADNATVRFTLASQETIDTLADARKLVEILAKYRREEQERREHETSTQIENSAVAAR